MKEYFENKYGKQFTIYKIGYSGGILGEPLMFIAKSYPKDEKTIKFDIERYANLQYANQLKYHENYLTNYWSKQIKIKVQNIFNGEPFTVDIMAPLPKIQKAINGRTIDIDEELKEYGDAELFITSYKFVSNDYYSSNFLKIRDSSKNALFRRIVKLKDKRFNKIVFSVYYVDAKFRRLFSNGSYKDFYVHRFGDITVPDINTIDSLADIQKYMIVH